MLSSSHHDVWLSIVFVTICCSISFTSSYPIHASCKLEWVFSATSCDVVQTKLLKQINAWKGKDNCDGGGEKCLYSLVSSSPSQIMATHSTPEKKYVDSLTMSFSSNALLQPVDSRVSTFQKIQSPSHCHVMAQSRSNVWYALLDFGTNYCNLHNLVVGSGLSNVTGFIEKTSDSVCTQYSSSNCDVY